MELLTVSLSFKDFLPRLTFTCFCFIFVELFHLHLFVTRKYRRLSEPYFLSSGWMWPFFPCAECHTCPSIFQCNCPTQFCVAATQCSFINYKPPYCLLFFIHYSYFAWTATPFCLFLKGTVPFFFVRMSHKYPVCPLPYLCVNVTQISLCLHYF